MAKANGISKKLLAKKDVNFFAEFTANAAKAARMLGYGVAVGVLVVFVVLTFIVAFFIRNTIIKGQIRDLENLLASPEYATLEQDYAVLTEQLNEMTNYYYALSQMRKTVDQIDPAPTDLPDVIAKCIPSDSFISQYAISNSQLSLSGYTFTYYSPVDMVNMLNDKGVFASRASIETSRVDVTSTASVEDLVNGDSIEAINNYYAFSISGVLVGNVHISVTRLVNAGENSTVLGGVETIDVRAGDSYTINGISNYNYAGISYQLTGVTVDGILLDEVSFNDILTSDQYVDVGRGNSEIKLYYTPVTAEAPAEG
ncbi:MAG: hypothetical protein IKE09_02565 [Clostridiales bacterium]|nr:hypothetical protein [Clostridiales bacterium]